MNLPINQILQGDALTRLRELPSNSVHCCVTSPPYWGLRDYGTGEWIGGDENCKHEGKPFRTRENVNRNTGTGTDKKNGEGKQFFKDVCGHCGAGRVDHQLGLEKTPEEFIRKMVEIFEEVRRILRPDGTCWVNMGDSYCSTAPGTYSPPLKQTGILSGVKDETAQSRVSMRNQIPSGCKPKDLMGIPWMLAFALRSAGWYLRQDIIWHKPNPMPESVTDRCTKAHEYIFLLSKSRQYFYDAEAIKKPWEPNEHDIKRSIEGQPKYQGKHKNGYHNNKPDVGRNNLHATGGVIGNALNGANKRSVWTVTTSPFPGAHFATFPEDLIVDCIKAGTSEHGCCGECGAPWERIMKKELVPGSKASFNSVADERDFVADAQDQGSNRMKDGHKPGWVNKTETTGWKPTCKCKSELKLTPALVLDPFSGAGTTMLVTRKLNRAGIGIELNHAYIKIANKRLKKELGMFYEPVNETV